MVCIKIFTWISKCEKFMMVHGQNGDIIGNPIDQLSMKTAPI